LLDSQNTGYKYFNNYECGLQHGVGNTDHTEQQQMTPSSSYV